MHQVDIEVTIALPSNSELHEKKQHHNQGTRLQNMHFATVLMSTWHKPQAESSMCAYHINQPRVRTIRMHYAD